MSQPPVLAWNLACVYELIYPTGSTVNNGVSPSFFGKKIQAVIKRLCYFRLAQSVVKLRVKHQPIMLTWVDDIQKVLHLALCAFTWINYVISKFGLCDMFPRIAEPRIRVPPRNASSHRNEVACRIHPIEVPAFVCRPSWTDIC